jgi:hypothetical protein
VTGVALAAILLHEGLTPIQVAGGIAILVAALILQRSTPPGGRPVAAPAIEADDPDEPDPRPLHGPANPERWPS